MKELTPFERWMVKQNLEHAKKEGLEAVLVRLRRQGYIRVADAVEKAAKEHAS